jgi:hypothetical protein
MLLFLHSDGLGDAGLEGSQEPQPSLFVLSHGPDAFTAVEPREVRKSVFLLYIAVFFFLLITCLSLLTVSAN